MTYITPRKVDIHIVAAAIKKYRNYTDAAREVGLSTERVRQLANRYDLTKSSLRQHDFEYRCHICSKHSKYRAGFNNRNICKKCYYFVKKKPDYTMQDVAEHLDYLKNGKKRKCKRCGVPFGKYGCHTMPTKLGVCRKCRYSVDDIFRRKIIESHRVWYDRNKRNKESERRATIKYQTIKRGRLYYLFYTAVIHLFA